MKFTNPWEEQEGFINLGTYTFPGGSSEHPKDTTTYFELYVIKRPNEVSLGARYADEPSAYLSGTAYLHQGKWDVIANSAPLLTAAVRYFANHHHT